MAKNEEAIWGIIGAIVGILLVGAINVGYTLIGALIGALIGIFLGKKIK